MDKEIIIRRYEAKDIGAMIEIWNEVVREGNAFPQEECLSQESGTAFFAGQSFCGVAEEAPGGALLGMYILHPNNVGRCGHIANASYAVASASRGRHIGGALVEDSLAQARSLGFRLMQFNAVVDANTHARHLYERLGFRPLGRIPGGFLMKDGHYEDIWLYYIELR